MRFGCVSHVDPIVNLRGRREIRNDRKGLKLLPRVFARADRSSKRRTVAWFRLVMAMSVKGGGVPDDA